MRASVDSSSTFCPSVGTKRQPDYYGGPLPPSSPLPTFWVLLCQTKKEPLRSSKLIVQTYHRHLLPSAQPVHVLLVFVLFCVWVLLLKSFLLSFYLWLCWWVAFRLCGWQDVKYRNQSSSHCSSPHCRSILTLSRHRYDYYDIILTPAVPLSRNQSSSHCSSPHCSSILTLCRHRYDYYDIILMPAVFIKSLSMCDARATIDIWTQSLLDARMI